MGVYVHPAQGDYNFTHRKLAVPVFWSGNEVNSMSPQSAEVNANT